MSQATEGQNEAQSYPWPVSSFVTAQTNFSLDRMIFTFKYERVLVLESFMVNPSNENSLAQLFYPVVSAQVFRSY